MSETQSKNSEFPILRATALVSMLVGVVGSVWLTLYTGRKNESYLLLFLFVVWVLSPFAILLYANRRLKEKTNLTSWTLYMLMIFVAVASLIGYSGIWNPPGTHTAFMFLIIPLILWVMIAFAIPIAVVVSKRR